MVDVTVLGNEALGNKALSLIRLRDDFHLDVPAFTVIPFADVMIDFDAHRAALVESINIFLRGDADSRFVTAISDRARAIELDDDAVWDFYRAIADFGWETVSFRTSAVLEDSAGHSFAGQFESFLDVTFQRHALTEHLLACFRSMFSPRVLTYAKAIGLTEFDLGGSVIVQEMFYGDLSGVVFTENGQGAVSVAVSPSWRNTVVEGDDASEIVVPRDEVDTTPMNAQIRALIRSALELETRVGTPIDIEWAASAGRLVFLQFRPITVPVLESAMEWDSTNIAENYPGITLPLTYSVIRELYAGVYPSFLRLLGTSDARLRDAAGVFDNMLGYLNGHVYYRISNWYEVLRFLPGRRNQEFFEAMLNPVTTRGENQRGRGIDARSLATLVRFLWLLASSERRSQRFRDRFAKRLAFFSSYHVDFVNVATLLDESKRIRQQLLADWAVPILNDVKLMVFHGLLKRLFFTEANHAEYLDFLQGLTDRESLRPLEKLGALGRTICSALDREGVTTIADLRTTASWADVAEQAQRYIDSFGARTPGELKLETVRLSDDLTTVLELALKASASAVSSIANPVGTMKRPASVSAIRWPLLRWVARHTRRAIDWRERFRFNRAQTFDLSRTVFDAVGKALCAEGLIDNPRDIYWLTEYEVDAMVNGHAWSLDARDTVANRKESRKEYEKTPMSLAVRGAGRIAPHHLSPVSPASETASLGGNGVAPGVLTAPVVVATEFDPALDVRGAILVVHHVDPGWTLLFTQAAGIVAGRGNALSHAAIVAREIGIPAIVGVSGATTQLETGDVITINGTTGSIDRATA